MPALKFKSINNEGDRVVITGFDRRVWNRFKDVAIKDDDGETLYQYSYDKVDNIGDKEHVEVISSGEDTEDPLFVWAAFVLPIQEDNAESGTFIIAKSVWYYYIWGEEFSLRDSKFNPEFIRLFYQYIEGNTVCFNFEEV